MPKTETSPNVQEILDRAERYKEQQAEADEGDAGNHRRAVSTAKAAQPNDDGTRRAPTPIKGESPNTSRGFRFTRLMGALANGEIDRAKTEAEIAHTLDDLGYRTEEGGILAPLNPQALSELHPEFAKIGLNEMFEDVPASERMQRRMSHSQTRALGEDDDTLGGVFVQPQQAAEIIPLLRAQSVVERAGARVIDLPQSGSMDMPKQTGGATAYWVGENETINDSDLSFGSLAFREKQLAGAVFASNRMLRHATPSMEAMIREDLTRVLALERDHKMLYGTGGANMPQGIANTNGIDTALGGSALAPEDFINARRNLRRNNATGEPVFVFNADIEAELAKFRADAVTQGDDAGQFIIMEPPQGNEPVRVFIGPQQVQFVTSEQVPTNTGSPDTTDIFYGIWNEAVIAQGLTMELSMTGEGQQLQLKDQTLFRAILGVDFKLRHEGLFGLMENVELS